MPKHGDESGKFGRFETEELTSNQINTMRAYIHCALEQNELDIFPFEKCCVCIGAKRRQRSAVWFRSVKIKELRVQPALREWQQQEQMVMSDPGLR